MKAQIIINLKKSVLDPQGDTIARALSDMGCEDVAKVRQGKVIEIEIKGKRSEETEKILTRICDKLLVNPVMETYEIQYL